MNRDCKPFPCFDCNSGHYEVHIERYGTVDSAGKMYVIPHVPIARCTQCGSAVISRRAEKIIHDGMVDRGWKYRRRHGKKSVWICPTTKEPTELQDGTQEHPFATFAQAQDAVAD